MILPSLLVAWPRVLAHSTQLDPGVVKLRSGKVALLFPPDVTIEAIRTSKTKRRGLVQLEPLLGFVEGGRDLSKSWLLAPVILCCVYLAVTTQSNHPKEQQLEIKKPTQTVSKLCAAEPEVGMKFSSTVLHNSKAKIGKVQFTIRVVSQFGGLSRLQLTRKCDAKSFKLEAWKANNFYLVSKVN